MKVCKVKKKNISIQKKANLVQEAYPCWPSETISEQDHCQFSGVLFPEPNLAVWQQTIISILDTEIQWF